MNRFLILFIELFMLHNSDQYLSRIVYSFSIDTHFTRNQRNQKEP